MSEIRPDPAAGAQPAGANADRERRPGAEHAAAEVGPPPHDELDALLRAWHRANADRAAAGRAKLVAALSSGAAPGADTHPGPSAEPFRFVHRFRSVLMNPITRVAAVIALLLTVVSLFLPYSSQSAMACEVVQIPDGGRLEALDEQGRLLGPCPLKHTDVDVDIAGHFSRVTLRQTYTNPYAQKIEAVYTFPMSHRSAVDRMRMIVGERIIDGEVKEREAARRIYEAARESGYVASLLEQERPNIFTQSVANIEPYATVEVEISYIETLERRDGVYTFSFPMVVGPRYIPGSSWQPPAGLPDAFEARRGVVLLGPATITIADGARAPAFASELPTAIPVDTPGPSWWQRATDGQVTRRFSFTATYADGATEKGEFFSDGCGHVNGRWFCLPERSVQPGDGFSPNTDQVPDASKITPMPVRPPMRAGHDVSMSISIDTGGPEITNLMSELHKVVERERETPGQATLVLANQAEIPNRDFVLRWSLAGEGVKEGIFAHFDTGERDGDAAGAAKGGFVTLVLDPPARVEPSMVRPRELVFVLDTSGSMRGFPIEKAKEVMSKAIDNMRPHDTFNVVAFAGSTRVLWPEPRPATPENRAAAQSFVSGQSGGGGTEMMKAIEAALVQTTKSGAELSAGDLANLPADGRRVTVVVPYSAIEQDNASPFGWRLRVNDRLALAVRLGLDLPTILQPEGVSLQLTGSWRTEQGERVLTVNEAGFAGADTGAPMRICMFLTDGYVGNDQAIIAAVRENARTTRVFSFGIGNSVNRYLLENMALAGRGACEFVLLSDGAAEAVDRFVKRIENPVLTDIRVTFSDGLGVTDLVPGEPGGTDGLIPDLFDVKPLVLHGRYRTGGSGTVTITGRTGQGPYERTIPITLPSTAQGHAHLPALWARAKVESVLAPHLAALQAGSVDLPVRQEVVRLGETFQIMTPFTSFVAVEKARVTIGGKPMLVQVPIELPQGTSWEGFFGPGEQRHEPALVQRLADTALVLYAFERNDVNVFGRDDIDQDSTSVTEVTSNLFSPGVVNQSNPVQLGLKRLINRAHEGASMDALGQSVTTISQKASRTDEIAVHLRATLAQDDESSMIGVERARRIMAMYGPADERDLATASAIELRYEPGESQNVATSDAPVSTRLRAAPRAAVRPVADRVQADAAPIAGQMGYPNMASAVTAGMPVGGVTLGQAQPTGGAPGAKGGAFGERFGAASIDAAPTAAGRAFEPPPSAPAPAPASSASPPPPGSAPGFPRGRSVGSRAPESDELRGTVDSGLIMDGRETRDGATGSDASNAGAPKKQDVEPQRRETELGTGGALKEGARQQSDVDEELPASAPVNESAARPYAFTTAGATSTDDARRIAMIVAAFAGVQPVQITPAIGAGDATATMFVSLPAAEHARYAATLAALERALEAVRHESSAWPTVTDPGQAVVIAHPIGDIATALGATPATVDTTLQVVLAEDVTPDPAPIATVLIGDALVVRGTLEQQEQAYTLLSRLRDELNLPIVVKPHPDPLPQAVLERVAAREALARKQARLETLWRTLAPALFAAVVDIEDPDATFVKRDALTEAAGDRPAKPTDRAIPVTVLVAEAPSSSALKAAGLKIDGVAPESRVVVGTIDATRLADLALVDGVRRVERR